MAGRGQMLKSELNLSRDRSNGHGLSQSVLPEIAHQAAPGALAVRQKDRCDRNNFPRNRALFFNKESVRPRGVEFVALWTAIHYPAIALAAFLGIGCGQGRGHG